MSKGSVIIAVVTLAAIFNEGQAGMNSLFYNPADSTVYIAVDTEYENSFVFRIKDGGSQIERTPPLDYFELTLSTHDNIPGRIYARIALGNDVGVSNNGGNTWSALDVPVWTWLEAAGENPGECFATGTWEVNDEWISALFSTTDSWESWDTSYVSNSWLSHDHRIFWGLSKGYMWRTPFHGELGEIHFSSDTGRTWTEFELEGQERRLSWIYPSVGTEFYHRRNLDPWVVTCVWDSCRQSLDVIDLLYYDDYDENQGDMSWSPGVVVPTNHLGEIYVVIDSTFRSYIQAGVKFDVFHIRDYGNEVNRYSYYLEDYKVGIEPEPSYTIPSMFSITAYPNPSNSGFNIDIYGLKSGATLYISDSAGRTLYTSDISAINKPYFLKWDANTNRGFFISTGNYIVSLKSESQFVNKVITIVR